MMKNEVVYILQLMDEGMIEKVIGVFHSFEAAEQGIIDENTSVLGTIFEYDRDDYTIELMKVQ